ncbi:hypothetical protein [Flavobacterium sp.]|uniref:hypothetical protein n=1 Tax=Flavobacterium sp. TaxID=239 RepID=UPI001213A445|nr:hypothetical protein [Flavobacterium sp.]RZJ71103.1 MAG: hypothetical protein EOO49_11675 [Flavobacterium sp.]
MALGITGSEAIEIMKTQFPTDWQTRVSNSIVKIKTAMRLYKLSALESYAKYVRQTEDRQNSIASLAAVQIMNYNFITLKKIRSIETQERLIMANLEALEKSNAYDYEDKRLLRNHYTSKQNECRSEVQQLLESIEVIGADSILYQPGIFDTLN